jgi:hypothetical protein
MSRRKELCFDKTINSAMSACEQWPELKPVVRSWLDQQKEACKHLKELYESYFDIQLQKGGMSCTVTKTMLKDKYEPKPFDDCMYFQPVVSHVTAAANKILQAGLMLGCAWAMEEAKKQGRKDG